MTILSIIDMSDIVTIAGLGSSEHASKSAPSVFRDENVIFREDDLAILPRWPGLRPLAAVPVTDRFRKYLGHNAYAISVSNIS